MAMMERFETKIYIYELNREMVEIINTAGWLKVPFPLDLNTNSVRIRSFSSLCIINGNFFSQYPVGHSLKGNIPIKLIIV